MTNPDPTRPAHYFSIEAITAMKAWMSPEMFVGFLHGNVLKYASRLAKNGVALEDAKKTQQYLGWLIDELEAPAQAEAAATTTQTQSCEVSVNLPPVAAEMVEAIYGGIDPASQEKGRFLGVMSAITSERRRQDEKWGEQNHDPEKWFVILAEEFGEVARAIYEGDLSHARTELIEVAAVAVAMVQSMERNQGIAAQPVPAQPSTISSQAIIDRIGSCFGYAMNGPNEGELCQILTPPAWDGKYILMRPDAPDEMFSLTDAPEGEVYFLGVNKDDVDKFVALGTLLRSSH